MKNVIIIGCLIGSIFAFSGDLSPIKATYSLATDAGPSNGQAPNQAANEMIQPSLPPSTVTQATYSPEETAVLEPKKSNFTLESVNGITLYDNPAAVVEKLGEPEKITQDPHLKELMIYEYPDLNIVFSDGVVNFLELPASTATLLIDGTEITATFDAVKEALGEPAYVTEDGFVFERNEALLKLFVDDDTGKMTAIHYFHSFSE